MTETMRYCDVINGQMCCFELDLLQSWQVMQRYQNKFIEPEIFSLHIVGEIFLSYYHGSASDAQYGF